MRSLPHISATQLAPLLLCLITGVSTGASSVEGLAKTPDETVGIITIAQANTTKSAVTSASEACLDWTEADATRTDLVVGEITIDAVDVFNPKLAEENLGIHRLANKLHINTRKSVIEKQLLFSEGEPFLQRTLNESARNLRANRFLRSASVTPTQVCANRVNVLVETGDNWSLIPSFNFSRAGGENLFAFKLAEINLLGLGKSLDLELDFGPDRDQQVLRYTDPLLFGTRNTLAIQLQNNSDGEVRSVALARPFYSFDTRRAWRVSATTLNFSQILYKNGLPINQLAVDRELFEASFGWSSGFKNERVWRTRLGWRFERTNLAATTAFPASTPEPERLFNFPFVEFSFLRPNFIERTNLNIMGSVEDVDIGSNFRLRTGIALETFESTEDALFVSGSFRRGWRPNSRVLLQFTSSLQAYQTESRTRNLLASVNTRAFIFQSRRSSVFLSGRATIGENLFDENQIVLGGATGARGYPLRFRSGDRRALFTLEQRYFFPWFPLRLARIAAAAFADAGAAWEAGEEPELLSDIGAGIRIVGTRQADAKVMHIDLAFPLSANENIEKVQLVVTAKTRF